MVYTVIDHRNYNYKFKSGTTSRRRVVSLKRFEHFDVVSKVDNSTDHGKLLSIFFYNIIDGFEVEVSRKNVHERNRQTIAPPSRHFMVCTHIDHIAIDQSARGKSHSYSKTIFRTKKIKCCDCQATYIGETGRNPSYRRKIKFTGIFQLHYATDRAHNEPLGLFCVFWPSTRVQ